MLLFTRRKPNILDVRMAQFSLAPRDKHFKSLVLDGVVLVGETSGLASNYARALQRDIAHLVVTTKK
jgi:hypothetical protein